MFSSPQANSFLEEKHLQRTVDLWIEIAEKYKDTDFEKVYFEPRNEPRDITAEGRRFEA